MTLAKTKRNDIASNRICVMGEFNSSIYLHAHCSCGSDNHQQTLEIEVDEDDGDDINLLIYSKAFTAYQRYEYSEDWKVNLIDKLKDWRNRVKWICSILFHGYVEVENVFTLSGKAQIEDYLDAISRARNKLWIIQERQKRVQATQESVECTPEIDSDGC